MRRAQPPGLLPRYARGMLRAAGLLSLVLLAAGCGGPSVAPAPVPADSYPDHDGDGVPDVSDACPRQPEDRDGSEDADGCPDPDNDQDGVPDASDLCPNDPEDMDAYQDADGCPDPDNDQDRILDVGDQCPCIPEVFNGYEDEDGCPDRGRILLIDERVMILDKVYFARRSASVAAASVRIIEAVADTLTHNPQLTLVEVAGHATRDEPGAQALSEARAVAVRDALATAGVDPARLVTRAHGSAQPLVPGRSREASEQNRRVEFVILEPSQLPDSSEQPPLPGPIPNCPAAPTAD